MTQAEYYINRPAMQKGIKQNNNGSENNLRSYVQHKLFFLIMISGIQEAISNALKKEAEALAIENKLNSVGR